MNYKLLITIATAASITAVTTTALAAPLPAGVRLAFVESTDGFLVQSAPCPNGSCFGMYLFSGLYYWTPLGPGSDGGLIIGKGQQSGGQEINRFSSNSGELTEVWHYGGNTGTFFTAPNSTDNIFDDASCTGLSCIGRTELKVWNIAWGGQTVPLGSASGCDQTRLPACTADQVAGIFVKSWAINPPGISGGTWELRYSQVVPELFTNYPFELVLRGTATHGDPLPPVIVATPANLAGFYGVRIPFRITVTGTFGTTEPACRVGTAPLSGVVYLNGCANGDYIPNIGFIGTDSFTLIVNDVWNGISVDSFPFTVNVAVTDQYATPTILPTYSPTSTPISTPTITPSVCTDMFPVSQATLIGKKSHLSITVTGNIVSVNPNGKEIKICPTTTASYDVSTNTPGATVVCQVKFNTTRGKGRMKINDQIKCTDKPVGNDKIHIKIKSGVNQKPM